MKKVNYHTHTTRCLHAVGKDEDYVISAIENGLHTLGFSDHAPYEDNRYGLRMQYNELDDYFNSINSLKEKYKDKIDIKIGLEIEYDKNQIDYYKKLSEKFDYLVLGQHVCKTSTNPFINSFELNNTDEYLIYANAVSEALDTKLFSFLAHPDLIFLNNFPWDNNCEKACEIIVNAAKRNNSILEVNANGVRRGIIDFCDGQRYRYPHKKFWDKVQKENIRVLVSSDAHSPDEVYDESTLLAMDLAKEWNLNIIDSI
ncbi:MULTISPECIES: histidinol-phosphatase [Clostridium]|uniref:Histidinol-phosphatase n=2 Tax=Clostridium TaxID=1485 RepID=A0ABN1LIB2_9CLOT|nr:histidinol-phosphatase [Clostridium baratii]MBT9832087.1 histidinol-phosphatase HisJ family protein [Clostridium baratii]STA99089.1 histidinol phosphatase [Clostridium baratii]